MEKTLFPIPLMGLLILTIYLPNIFAQDVPELAENALPATVYLEITDKPRRTDFLWKWFLRFTDTHRYEFPRRRRGYSC